MQETSQSATAGLRYDAGQLGTAASAPPVEATSGLPVLERRSEFAANWRVLLAATLGCGLGASSLPFYSFGIFVLPLTRQFGWTRGQMTSALLFMTLALAITSPLLGAAIDRYGSRRVALLQIPLLSLCLGGLGLNDGSLMMLYALFAAIAIFAGGTTPINYTRLVNQHFVRSRGLALGLALCGLGLSALMLPLAATIVMDAYGWRAAYFCMALLALCAWPAMFAGAPSRPARLAGARPTAARDLAFLKRREFWTVALTCFFVSGAFTGLVVHLAPFLRDAGFSAGQAAGFSALIGLGGIAGRLVVGALVDRMFAPFVGAAAFALTGVGCALLATYGPSAAPAAAVVIGFSFGAEVDIMSFLVARYFGLRRYGLIYGVVYCCFAVGGAFGPAIGGAVFDATGSYLDGLWGAAVILAAGALAMTTLPAFPQADTAELEGSSVLV